MSSSSDVKIPLPVRYLVLCDAPRLNFRHIKRQFILFDQKIEVQNCVLGTYQILTIKTYSASRIFVKLQINEHFSLYTCQSQQLISSPANLCLDRGTNPTRQILAKFKYNQHTSHPHQISHSSCSASSVSLFRFPILSCQPPQDDNHPRNPPSQLLLRSPTDIPIPFERLPTLTDPRISIHTSNGSYH